jgi:hypothetical protein
MTKTIFIEAHHAKLYSRLDGWDAVAADYDRMIAAVEQLRGLTVKAGELFVDGKPVRKTA